MDRSAFRRMTMWFGLLALKARLRHPMDRAGFQYLATLEVRLGVQLGLARPSD